MSDSRGLLLFWGVLAIPWSVAAGNWIAHPTRLLGPLGCLGALLAYAIVAAIVNTKETTIARGVLSYRSTPLWTPGNRSVPISDVAQLVLAEVPGDDDTTSTWSVDVVGRDGRRSSPGSRPASMHASWRGRSENDSDSSPVSRRRNRRRARGWWR